ncbi:MAG: YggT family protein [Treponema sp.]|nr:YggT family protein [Treponema sp.]MBQ2601045.1 YggT family protein [Treponema sp.]
MNPVGLLLNVLSAALGVYAILCMIRIIMTWVPQMNGNGFSNFLVKICDPYLNLFKNIKWLRFGGFDFSPALGLCILSAASTLLGSFSGRGFSLSFLIQTIIGLAWNIVQSILIFLIILLIVRLILLSSRRGYGNSPIMNAIDSSMGNMVQKISSLVVKGSNPSYKSQLIAAIVILILAVIIGSIVIGLICNLLSIIILI